MGNRWEEDDEVESAVAASFGPDLKKSESGPAWKWLPRYRVQCEVVLPPPKQIFIACPSDNAITGLYTLCDHFADQPRPVYKSEKVGRMTVATMRYISSLRRWVIE